MWGSISERLVRYLRYACTSHIATECPQKVVLSTKNLPTSHQAAKKTLLWFLSQYDSPHEDGLRGNGELHPSRRTAMEASRNHSKYGTYVTTTIPVAGVVRPKGERSVGHVR